MAADQSPNGGSTYTGKPVGVQDWGESGFWEKDRQQPMAFFYESINMTNRTGHQTLDASTPWPLFLTNSFGEKPFLLSAVIQPAFFYRNLDFFHHPGVNLGKVIGNEGMGL